jgi:hypothetical protein
LQILPVSLATGLATADSSKPFAFQFFRDWNSNPSPTINRPCWLPLRFTNLQHHQQDKHCSLPQETTRKSGTMKLPTIYNVHLVAIIATLGGAL